MVEGKPIMGGIPGDGCPGAILQWSAVRVSWNCCLAIHTGFARTPALIERQ
jgi:hypothetical protein